MLDYAPFPATASAEGAQFNVPPSLVVGEGPPLMRRPSADAVAGNGWDGGGERRPYAVRLFTPRPLPALPRLRGKVAALPAPTLSRRRGACVPIPRGLI